MTCEIFLRSFRPDREWLAYCLRSLQKHARGFSGVTVTVPEAELDDFLPLESYHTADGAHVLMKRYFNVPGKGFIMANLMACYADAYCPLADFILYTDSDCLVTQDITPATYFTGDKPQLLFRTFDSLRKQGQPYSDAACWQSPVERALKFPAPYEVMARHPAVHPRALLRELRDHIERVHGCPFYDFVMASFNSPLGFAEFPTLGMFAIHAHPDWYDLIDVSGWTVEQVKSKYKREMTQQWSHGRSGNIYEEQKRECERVVA
jgi:hypothetical protein